MKYLLLSAAFGLACFAGPATSIPPSPAPGGTQPLRFVIAASEYEGMTGGKITLRIDTTTGQTWRLGDLPGENGPVTMWFPVAENAPQIKTKPEGAKEAIPAGIQR